MKKNYFYIILFYQNIDRESLPQRSQNDLMFVYSLGLSRVLLLARNLSESSH